jgi:tRNA A-37 threonylcarbamoyl transferase component Bud32/tetratricopeptide (TPR) repeat protein
MPADPRWQRVQDLFDTASAWPAVERAARLEPLEADAALRAEVLALLAASDAESRASLPADPHRPAPLPEWIGPFRVLAVAGAGGRGIVYRAVRDASGVVQTVAVKVMREHLLSPEDLARFEREQRALVSLDHPGIARLVESGWDANGRPYFAMEWIEGQPIDEYCVALGLPDRLRLMIEVLDALHAAHRALIVHLDLKPSNVLVDSTGRVRILDFGTAKLLAGNETLSTEQLTPLYASPERLRAEPATTACDIYSAGLLLNRILAGRLPFGDSTSIAALGERATGAALPEVSTGDADLDAILGRALEFRPADRYASIAEFASDLRALLDKRPVSARRPTALYRLGRFAARNRALVAVSAAALLAVTAFASYGVWQQRLGNREAARAKEVASFLRWMITSSAVPGSGDPNMTVVEMVRRASNRLDAGHPMPADVAASIQADFAHLTREFGREDLAEPMARAALDKANASGDTEAGLRSRATLGGLLTRRADCPAALDLFRSGDALLKNSSSRIPAIARAEYLTARAAAAEQCEAKPAAAVASMEQALEAAASAEPVFRAGLLLNYSLMLARSGRADDARAAADKGLALAASHPDGRYFQVALLRIRSQNHATAGRAAEALADAREAARLGPGVVNPFEEIRLQTLLAGRTVDAGDPKSASSIARAAVADARARQNAVGPSFWMILADAAEVFAKTRECGESESIYREVESLTKGRMPRAWRGNRLFYAAECALPSDPARARTLAAQAQETYGELLQGAPKRRARIQEILALQ